MAMSSRTWVPLLLALTLLSTLEARGQSLEVKRYLSSAAALYESLEYEKALSQLSRAKKKSAGAEDDLPIALYEGIVLADMGRDEAAFEAFKSGLSLEPEAKLPLVVSPKAERLFERARTRVKQLLATQVPESKPTAPTPEPLLKQEPLPEPLKIEQRPTAKTSLRRYSWIPAVAGAGLLAGGAVFYVQASEKHSSLEKGTAPPGDSLKIQKEGQAAQTAAFILGGAGIAALGTAAVMFFSHEDEPALSLGVALTDGVAVSLSGTF